ncbi:hypothetical protein GcC1_155025 [Golovinomyces cichoracearum]|uniref:Uncharacterized protein n=1 Tax=Golovinomyces cichoracearum TaxID=62708 RepID=A0A420HVQ8_9PEZI|nr:hypothetical protein GcC1_155025 [Golovinomyces cichoracearum]
MTQKYGPPQACVTANEQSKKHKVKQSFTRPLWGNRQNNQHH